jgi:hypothetical protein
LKSKQKVFGLQKEITLAEISTEEDSMQKDISQIQLKLESQENKKKFLKLKQKVESVKGYLRNINQIKKEVLDKEFLINLPDQILETLEEKRVTFDDIINKQDNQVWANKSAISRENECTLSELQIFLESKEKWLIK